MFLKSVYLNNFRNYEHQRLKLSKGASVFVGMNAQGKTNFLEAVNVLCTSRSFRTKKDEEMVNNLGDQFFLSCIFEKDDMENSIEFYYRKGEGKSMKINGNNVSKVSELYGRLCCVSFVPDELKLIDESPSYRRHFFDLEIAKINPAFLEDIKNYKTALKNKNVLLKSNMNKKNLFNLIDIYNRQLCQYAQKIIASRAYFVELLNERSTKVNETLSKNRDLLSISYKCSVSDIKNSAQELYLKYKESYEKECEAGYTLLGPHKEDFLFLANEKPISAFGSQGQQRSAVLSIKIGIAKIIEEKRKTAPILLLDDVFSELDNSRCRALLEAVKDNQVLITATGVPLGLKGLEYDKRRVFGGEII